MKCITRFQIFFAALLPLSAPIHVVRGADPISILNFGSPSKSVDRTGVNDVSEALSAAVTAANLITVKGEPACVHIPTGRYLIFHPPPMFALAGCIRGDGSTQSILLLDKGFHGDLFSWSEAWAGTTSGPTVSGITVLGTRGTDQIQNALVFYDRIDCVSLDDISISNLHGRALYSGQTMMTSQAYIRESRMRSLRFFGDGTDTLPVVEFHSEGGNGTDATNEVRLSDVDIYGARGASLVISNAGLGSVRDFTLNNLRIEGSENGQSAGDLFRIGDSGLHGSVNNVVGVNVELINPAAGYAALHITAAPGGIQPYQIKIEGLIGGGASKGEGLRIDAGRLSSFHFSAMHTLSKNVVIGPGVTGILLDGYGDEVNWTYDIDPGSRGGVFMPVWRHGFP